MNTLLRKGLGFSPEKTNPALLDDKSSRSRLSLPAESDNAFAVEMDETLVVDERAGLRPAQMVELKLRAALHDRALPVSHIQMANSLRPRK